MEPGAGDFGGYFQQLYQELVQQPDGIARRELLDGEIGSAAVHLAELEPLRVRERIPGAGHYTLADEQLRRLMRMYALSRISEVISARSSR